MSRKVYRVFHSEEEGDCKCIGDFDNIYEARKFAHNYALELCEDYDWMYKKKRLYCHHNCRPTTFMGMIYMFVTII